MAGGAGLLASLQCCWLEVKLSSRAGDVTGSERVSDEDNGRN